MPETTKLLVLLAFACGCGARSPKEPADRSDLFATSTPASEIEATEETWTSALERRQFNFPADHFAHDDYRIEWWYYTGNLKTTDGRRFGYQLTFFRTGLHKTPKNPSKWAVRDLYTAHFAVSDVRNQKHYCFQRNSRRGIGQAGARTEAYEVWNGPWSVRFDGGQHRLQAADSGVSIDLALTPQKPPVIHGDGGLSQKGATPGNSSHYYSLTRLSTTGSIRVGDQRFEVKGSSWMDHEFSTSFLEPGQVGWDWLSIQLDDGVDLMLYRMRLEDGATDPFSSGSLIDRDGVHRHLTVNDFAMTPLKTWDSQQTGASYPLHWRIDVPALGGQLRITPAFPSQEMTTADTTGISYWEGAVDVTIDGQPRGTGYMELTGYIGQGLGSLFQSASLSPP